MFHTEYPKLSKDRFIYKNNDDKQENKEHKSSIDYSNIYFLLGNHDELNNISIQYISYTCMYLFLVSQISHICIHNMYIAYISAVNIIF